MRLIINADDLGASEAVNKATFDLMARKQVMSATLLANGPSVREAVEHMRHFPECSFGIHLNITEFKPLSVSNVLEPLVGLDGSFNGKFHTALHTIPKNPWLFRAIAQEFCSQVEYLLSLGARISHIDSHHHVHTTPYLFPVIKFLQSKYQIRKVRLSKNIFRAGEPRLPVKIVKKAILNYFLQLGCNTLTTSGFTDLCTFYEVAQLGAVGHETVELMVHPGQAVDEGESKLLCAPWREDLPFKVDVINYHEL